MNKAIVKGIIIIVALIGNLLAYVSNNIHICYWLCLIALIILFKEVCKE